MTVEANAKFSAREFNQDVSAAKRAADEGPVIITDRGEPAYVLMSIKEYQQLCTPRRSIADAIEMSGDVDIAFDPAVIRSPPRPADL